VEPGFGFNFCEKSTLLLTGAAAAAAAANTTAIALFCSRAHRTTGRRMLLIGLFY
jgi:hypothetical protein